MPTLTEQLKQQKQADDLAAQHHYRDLLEQAGTLDSYRELIERANSPADGDSESIKTLMDKLGITLSELEADVEAIQQAPKLERFADPENVNNANQAADTAENEMNEEILRTWDRLGREMNIGAVPEAIRMIAGSFPYQIPGGFNFSSLAEALQKAHNAKLAKNNARIGQFQAAQQLAALKVAHPRVFGTPEQNV